MRALYSIGYFLANTPAQCRKVHQNAGILRTNIAIETRGHEMNLKNINIEQVAKAIEADAGEPLDGLRESLAQAKAGIAGRTHTPEQILVRQARQRSGLTQAAFAKRIATPVATLRDWEQGRLPRRAQSLACCVSSPSIPI